VSEIETTRTYNGWVQVKATDQAEVPVHHHFEPSTENDRRQTHGTQLAETTVETIEEKR
jgi:hypothetical protein